MGIGISVVLLVVGLILVTGAVNLPASVTSHVATDTVGWICLVVGIIGLVIAVMASRSNRNAPPPV